MPIKRKIIPYNPELKDLAKELRRNMTLSEVLLWNELKQKNMCGYDFDRQRPIDNFIVDFYCKELSLAIEIDGDTHIYRYDYDDERQKSLEKLGIHFLRFEDIEIKKNINNVLRVIEDWIRKNKPMPIPSEERNFDEKHTPDLSGEWKLRDKGLSNYTKPTPNPSEEGNVEERNTPDHFREGSLKDKGLSNYFKPTPNPSEERNVEENNTPNPSKKGNFKEKPTPSPSEKGNVEENNTPNPSKKGNLKEKPTPSPSKEGNYDEKHTPDLSGEGNLL